MSESRAGTFSYEGLTNLVTKEIQDNTGATTNTDTKTYNYDTYGHRISLNDSAVPGPFTYGYDVHGDVSLLVNQSNNTVKATYGYTPYGASDTTLSKGDTAVNTPFNPYRYTTKRYDTGSQTLDMGARRFDPTTQRFLQMDQYQGALADLTLSADPLTQNRYNLAGSNPLSAVEYDGHKLALDDGAGGGAAPVQVDPKKIMVTIPAPHGQCTYTDPTGCERAAPGTHAQTVSLYDLMHPKGPKNYCGWASFACTLVGINQTLNCFHGGGVGSCVGAVFAVGTDIFVVGKGAKLLSLASAGKAGSSLAAEAAGGPHLALGLTRTSAGPKALEQFAAERGAVTWTDPAFADIWGGAQAARPENVQLMIDRVVQSGGRISFNLTDIRDVEGIVSGRTVGLPPSQLTPCL